MRTSSAGLTTGGALRLQAWGTLLALTALGAAPAAETTPQAKIEPAVRQAARAAGIVVVASAGNTGPAPGSLRDPPAIYAAAVTVGSVDSGDTIADSSARGPVTVDASGRLKPDVTAPGVNIRSAVPGGSYGYGSGTSMAGPHVAGLAALILSAHLGLRGQVDRVEILITRSAVPRLDVPNNTYGWGRIDALAAVGLGDTDHDGIPNWWELIFGLNPTHAADAAEDVDADGFTALQEYAANTDPTNTTSALRITDLTVSTAGVVQVTWYSRPDGFGDTPRRYQVLRSARLPGDPEDWSPVATNVAAAGETTSITDCLGPAPPARLYYRVETVGAEGMATCATAARGVRVRDTPVLFVIQ